MHANRPSHPPIRTYIASLRVSSKLFIFHSYSILSIPFYSIYHSYPPYESQSHPISQLQTDRYCMIMILISFLQFPPHIFSSILCFSLTPTPSLPFKTLNHPPKISRKANKQTYRQTDVIFQDTMYSPSSSCRKNENHPF